MAKAFDRGIAPLLERVPSWIEPNHLTILRGLLIVPLAFAADVPWLAVTIVIVSSLLDILDGPLARHRGIENGVGKVLDPVSDKVFILGALFLACRDRVRVAFLVLVVAFEILLVAIRPVKNHFGATTGANRWGALKTWLQSIGIAFVLTRHPLLLVLSDAVFGGAVLAAFASFVGHLRDIRDAKRVS